MIILENKDYYKAITPLSHVKINTMFAEVIISQRIPGIIYVDCDKDPRTFYVTHPCGMSLLFGSSKHEAFNQDLFDYITNKNHTRKNREWLQVDPAEGWVDIMNSMVCSHNRTLNTTDDYVHVDERQLLVENKRVSFQFNQEAYLKTKKQLHNYQHEIVRISKELYMDQSGTIAPRFFWPNEDQFLAEGVGFSLLHDGEVASTAFSAFRNSHQLEIGIGTSEAHRGKGYAYLVCSALIEYCIDHQLEPVWACRWGNEGSYTLAQKLGFEPSFTIPYYRLVD